MTQDDAVSHWQHRAHSELKAARTLCEKGDDNLCGAVLFHCHLALKAEYIRKNDEAAPFSHDINELANAIRDGDEEWFDNNATRERAREWLKKSESFISVILKP